MKKNYKGLLLFQLIMFIVIFLNSFVWNILGGYGVVLFLIISLILFKVLFKLEKNREVSNYFVLDSFIFILLFFIIYYIGGIFFSFNEVGNYYTVNGFKNFILLFTLTILLTETLRFNMLKKCEFNKKGIIITFLLFTLLDITNSYVYYDFYNNFQIFKFFALILLPSITKNVFCTYTDLKVGIRPVLIYLLTTKLYSYLLPIVPGYNDFLMCMIWFLLPVIYLTRIRKVNEKIEDKFELSRKEKNSIIGVILLSIVTIISVYFISGYFKYQAIAVGSGSMSPNILKGDVVIFEKTNDYENLKVGDVLVYKYDNNLILHRIIKVVKVEDKYYFYTKGDSNKDPDNVLIDESMVVGFIKARIPYIGIPTVWVNNL